MKVGKTIEEMGAEILRQSKEKADYIVDTSRIELEAYGSNVILRMLDNNSNDAIEPLDVAQIAHRQIGTHLKIPAKYYDLMFNENPELLAYNVNTWFKQGSMRKMIRTLDGSARAFLSERYRRIDHLEILQSVLPIIGEIEDARFESCEVTDNRMYIKVVNPRLQTDIAVGDTVQAGVVISNSETGQGSVNIQPLIFRLVCQNGMIINDAATRKYHVGRANTADENFLLYSDETIKADDYAFLKKVQDTVKAAVDETRFNQVVDMMREAKEARMNDRDIPGIVKLASKDFGLTETEGEGVLNHLISGQDLSLYGLANAVTRHSQDVESYDRATKLESVGYDVMTMDIRQWNRLNQIVPVAIGAAA